MDNLLQTTLLRNGVILGLISILTFVAGIVTGLMDFSSILSSFAFLAISIAITVIILVYALSQYRSELNNNMNFKQAFIAAFGISLIGSLIGTVGQYFYTNFIDPSFYDTMAEQMTMMFEKYNVPEAEAQKGIAQIRNSGTIGAIAMNFLKSSIGTIIISLIIAAIMKKEPNNPFDNKVIDKI